MKKMNASATGKRDMSPRKSHRLIFALALLGLVVSCTNPTAPRYPQDQEDTGEDEPPPTQGLLLMETNVYFV